MGTCASTGQPLTDPWVVPGADGTYCAWHADLIALGNSIAEATPEHWLLDQIAVAITEPCPQAAPFPPLPSPSPWIPEPPAPPEPPPPPDLPAGVTDETETIEQALARYTAALFPPEPVES